MKSCAEIILCGLAAPVRAVIAATVQGVVLAMQAQLAQLNIALGAFKVLTFPLEATRQILQAQLALSQSVGVVLPTSIVGGCAELGGPLAAFDLNIQVARANVDREISRINRKLSWGDDLRDQIARLEAAIAELELNVMQVLPKCEAIQT
jgi:hypothetical protein